MNGDLNVLIFIGIVLLFMVMLSRWVFKPSRKPRVLVPADAVEGLLTPIASGLGRADALALRAVLGDADIRSSMSARRDGRFDVLVFRQDEERGRALVPPRLGG